MFQPFGLIFHLVFVPVVREVERQHETSASQKSYSLGTGRDAGRDAAPSHQSFFIQVQLAAKHPV